MIIFPQEWQMKNLLVKLHFTVTSIAEYISGVLTVIKTILGGSR